MTKEVYSETLDKHISNIDGFSDEFSGFMDDISSEVQSCIATSSGGVYGSLGNKLLELWNSRCDSFENYYKLYQLYVGILSSISTNNKEFIVETEVEYGGDQNG